MFVSHYATGLVLYSKKQGSKTAFFLLVLGTQLADVLWGLFTILGIEGGLSGGSVKHNYFDIPWSHSLSMILVWSILYGVFSQFWMSIKGHKVSNFGLYAGFSVFSHWILDFIVHNDDMRIFPKSDSSVPSLYLWKYPYVTLFLEIIIIYTCWFYYRISHTLPSFQESKKPQYLLFFLIILHVFGYLPTLTNSDPIEATPIAGVVTFLMVSLIPLIMMYLHPEFTYRKELH